MLPSDLDADAGKPAFDTPWTSYQTETHLVFGPLSRHLPFAYVMAVAVGLLLLDAIINKSTELLPCIALVYPVNFLFRLPLRRQAIVGWIFTKCFFGLVSAVFVLVIAPMRFSEHGRDAWLLLCLGLIWLPHLEFIRVITPYQRFLTAARVAATVLCLTFLPKTGIS